MGATVMPHNLFLHSSIVLTRSLEDREESTVKEAIAYSVLDSTVSLTVAFFVNCAILIVSAATFHENGYKTVATLSDAYNLLGPLLGTKSASILFAVALLASGQNSTLTGTLAGQVVMEGFLTIKMPPALRRLLTRLVAIIPAIIVTVTGGEEAIYTMLIWSQVILSFALPFAIFPLANITSDARRMGPYCNSIWTKTLLYCIGLLILALNITLLFLIA
jgi:manganese transport protein